jgi:hypothetical protein
MIDKIVITLNDSGQFELNIGDMIHTIEHTPMDCLRTVNNHLRKLAYFPKGINDMNANPIPYKPVNNKK